MGSNPRPLVLIFGKALVWAGVACFGLGILPLIRYTEISLLLTVILELSGAGFFIFSIPVLIYGGVSKKLPSASIPSVGRTIGLAGLGLFILGIVNSLVTGANVFSFLMAGVAALFFFISIPVRSMGGKIPGGSPGSPPAATSGRIPPRGRYQAIDRYSFVFPGIVSFFFSFLQLEALSNMRFASFASACLLVPMLGGFLVYIVCPCTCGRARSNLFSWGSFGALVGFILGILGALPFFYGGGLTGGIAMIVLMTILPVLFSYFFHIMYRKGMLGAASPYR